MITRKKIKNKKGVSEIISYVLLIVISLGLATGVYTWLKVYVAPSQNEADICQENTAITLNDYSCQTIGLNKYINLDIQNTGYFSIDGFFIKVSNISGSGLATTAIKTSDYQNPLSGRYDFSFLNLKFSPGKKITTNFSYNELGSIKKIHIQPFVIGAKSKTIIPCENKIELDIDNCDSATTGTGTGTSQAPIATDCTAPVTDGLVAFWRFEGNALDCMNRNNGDVVGSVSWGTGKKEKGLTLDGTNGNYVSIANSADIQFGTNNFTISFWVNLTNDNSGITTYKWDTSGSGKWLIGIDTKNIQFTDDSTGPSILTQIPTDKNNWQQITFQRNGTKLLSFYNGVLFNQDPNYFNRVNLNNPVNLRIGCDKSSSNCLNGIIDELMIFNRTLDSNEISNIYNSQK